MWPSNFLIFVANELLGTKIEESKFNFMLHTHTHTHTYNNEKPWFKENVK